MLPRAQKVNGYNRVKIIMSTYGNSVKLGVIEKIMIVFDCRPAAVFLNAHSRLFGDNIAEILYLDIFVFHIRGNMRTVCDSTAADDCNFNFSHNQSLLNKQYSNV